MKHRSEFHNIMLLLNVFVVTWVVNIRLVIYLICLLLMDLSIKLLVPAHHISGLSLFEKIHGHAPDYTFFRIFGFTCFFL